MISITISDSAAVALVIFCIGMGGAFIGHFIAAGIIRVLIRFGWIAKRVVTVHIAVTEDQIADARVGREGYHA